MKGFFPTAFKFTLGRELGYSNQAADPGGSTQDGVTQATLDAARETVPGLPLDVKDLTQSDEAAIYQTYWNSVGGDALPNCIALPLFDAAVNSGPGTAVRWLQQSLGVGSDGKVGSMTLAAVQRADLETLLDEFSARRTAHFIECPQDERNEDALGWSRRSIAVYNAAKSYMGA
jgi:lysozyme family protein